MTSVEFHAEGLELNYRPDLKDGDNVFCFSLRRCHTLRILTSILCMESNAEFWTSGTDI